MNAAQKNEYGCFSDLCYEAWRRGLPEPSEDAFDRAVAGGAAPDEVSLDAISRRAPASEDGGDE